MPQSPSVLAAGARRLRPKPVLLAAVTAALALHAYLAFEVVGQPLDVGRAPPEARAPTWRLFNDSAHRAGPGADLFALYHAGACAGRGDPLYTRVESPPRSPYFFPFRYLPILADTLGRVLAHLAPRTAYIAWAVFLEALLALAILGVFEISAAAGERAFGVALLALSTPYLLELHMGQLTFAAALFATAAALAGERRLGAVPESRARGLVVRILEGAALAAACALKMVAIPALPLWAKRRRFGIFTAASLAIVSLAAIGFALHPSELGAFFGANFEAPLGGLDTGNVGPVYAIALIARGLGASAGDAEVARLASFAHLGILAATFAIVLFSRERRLWAGVAALIVAHFVGYVHVWEHHMSAVILVGAVVWLKRRDLAVPPGRAWSGLVALCLVLLALPTPFALLDAASDPAAWDAGGRWALGAKLSVACAKAVPLAALWGLLVHAHARAGFTRPWSFEAGTPIALALLALGAMIAFFSIGAPGAWTGFPLDDAWIHRVYARSFAYGHGLQYNAGADEAGSTSPLWAIATAPAEWLGAFSTGAVVVAVKAIGAAVAAAFVAGTYAVARALRSGGGTVAVAIPALVLAADPRLSFSLLSGMESALACALWIWAVYAAQTGRAAALASLAALLPTARPEAALLLPAVWALLIVAKGVGARRKAALLLVTIVPSALWVAFCLHATGHPLPTTFYVKASAVGDLSTAGRSALLAVARSGLAATPAFPLGLAGFAALWWSRRREAGVPLVLLVALPIAYALAVSASRAVRLDGYYWTRWYDPPALLLCAAAAIGLSHLVRRSLDAARRGIAGRIALAAVAAALAHSTYALAQEAIAARALLASNTRDIDAMNVAAGEWIDRNAPRGQVVGAHDAGAVKYFGRRPTIDLGGLNAHALAFDWSLAPNALARSSWLAVFPKKLAGTGALAGFEKRASFAVPAREYTICDCPQQHELAVYERRAF
jgi:hypothetical protein